MHRFFPTLMCVLLLGTLSGQVVAIDAAQVAKDKQSTTGLYFTSQEAAAHMQANGETTLFVDVRDPAEIFTVGMPSVADANVPFKRIALDKWDDKRGTFGLVGNPDFASGVGERLKAKGLAADDAIILICGSGKRAAKAASVLKEAGYSRVYSVVDGYKGWQKEGLAWSKKLDRAKM